MCADKYQRFYKIKLTERQLQYLDYPRPRPLGKEGDIQLYGDHYGFHKGQCKRCEKTCDVTFTHIQGCDFHVERSRVYRGSHQPHGCCGKSFGSKGCRKAPSHVYKDNLYLDLSGYRTTVTQSPVPVDGNHGVYAIDTESVHTKKGLELCKVTVINTSLDVVYDQYCQPTSEIIDYNTIWSGVTESSLAGVTKTYDDVRDDLLKIIYKETIVIGHGLNYDLISLKILHDNVVDTVILYPHHRRLPLKRSLKEIAQTVLRKSIQTGEGHDSKEDALVAMQLALRKI